MASKSSRAAVVSHAAGIFADMTLDGPEIGTLVIVVDRAKNLPNRKTMGKQDPYCAMRLGKEAKKTETDRRGGQTPKWDQELRFTVHDSPDYYKLKLSIFNDDKRADLIGEAFISLSDLIKPGGGSNDLWHQLSYKGRYAGDIRIEMTYYDMRPREEKAAEKKRQREKIGSAFGDSSSPITGLSGPRQLGPREVRRRPLPANPEPAQVAESTHRPLPLPREATLPSIDPYPQPIPEQHSHEQLEFHDSYVDSQEPDVQPEYEVYEQQYLEQIQPNVAASPVVLPDQTRGNDMSQRRRSHVASEADAMDPYVHDLPYEEYVDPSSGHDLMYDEPAMESESYRVSPLRQSMILLDQPADLPEEIDEPPPPPPRHQHPPRRTTSEYPPSSFTTIPVRPTPIRPAVADRSPLQNIEHAYGPNFYPIEPPQQQSQSLYNAHSDQYVENPVATSMQYGYQQKPLDIGPREFRPQPVLEHNSDLEVVDMNELRQGGRRRSFNPSQQNTPDRQLPPFPDRPRSHDDQIPQRRPEPSMHEAYMSSPHAQSMPSLPQFNTKSNTIPARPQKRQSMQTPPRKAVSPNPYHDDSGSRYPDEAGGRRLSGVPFSPDAYNVLNPASSPVTNENTAFETPEQARLSARLRESRIADDIGPIIDNEGRVIDPSDHLPTSSWAPEPERKQRKPEHVIHYRTKNEVRTPSTPGSSPASIRMNTYRSHPSTPFANSPNSVSSGSYKNVTTSTRPLPPQPSHHLHRDTHPNQQLSNRQPRQRDSYQEGYHNMHRPALSEYQIPIQTNHVPRGLPYQSAQPTLPRMSISSGRCSQNFDDPLAAEMSMIDIGPSRDIRSGTRMGRGY